MVALARPTRKIIGRYIGINYVRTRNELAGCINDARDWNKAHAPILTTEAKPLLETEATKAGIIRYIREGLAQLGKGDWLLLQMSGHGTQVPDSGRDEADRYDEAFCPYDMEQGLLYDDEIYTLLTQREPDSYVLLVTDCCHSGTMARSLAKQHTAPRFIPFKQIAFGMTYGERARLCASMATRSAADGIVPGVIHLSGCKDDEVSYDARFNNRANGALSYYAIRALSELKPGASFFDWHARIKEAISASKFRQSPQINADGEWFSVAMPGFELLPSTPPATSSQLLTGKLDDGRKFRLEIE